MKIGVLALQGAVREHIRHIELSGHEGIAVKKVEQLDEIDGLILPGGESTTLRRLMDLYGFKEKLQQSDLQCLAHVQVLSYWRKMSKVKLAI